jgi:hypothetical protein
MHMPYFIRRAIRKRDIRLYGQTNKRIRELEYARNSVSPTLWGVDTDWLDTELHRLRQRSATLRNKLTQEV